MRIKLPDYNNSIIGITSSVLKHYGIECSVKSLPVLDDKLKNSYKNIVVIVFDGLGSNILSRHLALGKDDFLIRHKKADISSVFPPTTTAATTSLVSGKLPVEHAWLGWSLYFGELDKNVNIFPNTISGTDRVPAAVYNVAERFIPYEDIFTKIKSKTNGEVEALSVYPFAGYKTRSTGEMCYIIKKLCGEIGCKYIHAYWHEPDSDMHELGVNHTLVTEKIRLFSRQIEELCGQLTDSLVIITADHGLVDTEYKYVTDYPTIAECMIRPNSIEGRAVNFFIKQGRLDYFEKAFNEVFGEQFILLSKQEVLDKKIFGDAPPHIRVDGFLGDFLAVAVGKVSIDYSRPAYRLEFKANHAGLTEDEMTVPLILIESL